MNIATYPTAGEANRAAADLLATWLTHPEVRRIMLATGNTPIELYRLIAERKLPLSHLRLFALDDYVGVPLDEPRNSANLLRQSVVGPWGIPPDQFDYISSIEAEARIQAVAHERKIDAAGGLDLIVLGLGQNGHLAFNEPGSTRDCAARVVPLETVSIEANRQWFDGRYAPALGATVGLRTILGARRVLIMAYGAHKRQAVQAMLHGPMNERCPASFLQSHANTHVFLDAAAAPAAPSANS
jgi:glucosamine-6-phosphate deaminase